MTTGKAIALTRWTFVGKIMSLLFNNAVSVGHSFSSKEQVAFKRCLFMKNINSVILDADFFHL